MVVEEAKERVAKVGAMFPTVVVVDDRSKTVISMLFQPVCVERACDLLLPDHLIYE